MKKRTILDFLSSQDTTPKKPCRKNKIEISNKENTKEIEINNKENTKEIEINNNKNKPCINKDEIKKTNKICINIKEIKETKDIDDNLLNKKHSQSNTTYNEYIPSSNESITPPIPSKNTSTKQSDRYPFLKNILDANHNPPTHPCYDPSTLYIDPTYLSTLTPFEQQFWNIKKNHFNTIVCFKKGKFYELYENDAEIGNKHFNLKLTDRVNMKMAGFPEAKFNYWAQEFLKKGYNIARIEQEENRIQQKIRLKNSNKGKSDKNKIIERKLKEIITPSTIYNYEMLPNNNIIYLCSIVKVKYNDKMRSDNNKVYNDNSNNSNDNNTITNNINNNNSNITINNNNIITNNYTISLLDCCSNKLYYTSTNDINKIIENNKIKEIITEEELEYKNIKIINTKELYNKYNYNMNNKSDINISMSDIGTISDISMNNSNNDNDGDNCNNNNNDNNNNNNNTINMNNLSTEERKSIEIIKIYLLLLNRRIDNIEILPYKHSMLIDNITIKNLNLIKDNSDNSNISNLTHTNLNTDNTDNNSLNIHNSNINTLLERIDYTLTPYGRRKLISYILSPLSSVKDILSRRILTHYIRNKDIIEIKEIEDIERVMGRLNNYKIKD
ncbi:MutSDNA mismatch repair protein, partial [Spraguea lophii 42_110]